MGHGPLINQTYEVIRGPTEDSSSASEARRDDAESKRLQGAKRSCLKTRFEEPQASTKRRRGRRSVLPKERVLFKGSCHNLERGI